MDEILKIQQQAAQVKLQIDRLRGRATALERLSELATISVRLQSAEAALARDFVAVRTQLRQAQSQQASLNQALRRARTPEEEAKIRDTLAELALQIERATARLEEIRQKAAQANVTLPVTLTEAAGLEAPTDDTLGEQYIATRVQLRRAEARQAEITRRLKLSLPPEEQESLRKELSEKILETSSLQARQKAIQDRAGQAGVVLPTLTAEQEAALAGTTVEVSQPDPLRAVVAAWEASLSFLRGALAAGLGALVFLWWTIPLLIGLAILIRSGRLPETWRPGQHPATESTGAEAPGA
jgi:hypothetical protein